MPYVKNDNGFICFLLTKQYKAGSCSGRANNLNKQKQTCTIFTYMNHKVSSLICQTSNKLTKQTIKMVG